MVRSVVLKRDLPSTVIIKIQERYPIAKLRSGTKTYLIDGDSVIIDKNGAYKTTLLPEITGYNMRKISVGKKLSSKHVSKALEFIELYKESSLRNYATIKQIDISESRVLKAFTTDGAAIDMDTVSFEKKISRLIAIYKDSKKKDLLIDTIDLRYNSVPIRYKKK
jgi:cell division protein FtsQ